MEAEYNSLIKAAGKYACAIGTMEAVLADKIEFEFSIDDIPGDGFCILNIESARVAPLIYCMDIIKEKKVLTVDSHGDICI